MDLRAQNDECLILRSRDFNESDRLLTVFGRNLGKMACLAKGVRKPKSRLKAATLPFVCGQLEFSASPRRAGQLGQAGSQGLRLITQGETLHSLPELRDDLVKIGAANYVAEMLDWVCRRKSRRRICIFWRLRYCCCWPRWRNRVSSICC